MNIKKQIIYLIIIFFGFMIISCGSEEAETRPDATDEPIEETSEAKLNLEEDVTKRDEMGRTPLHLSALQCNLEAVKVYLERGADIFAQDNMGWTALHSASSSGCVKVIEYILSQEPSLLEVFDKNGKTALHIAVAYCKYDAVQSLVDNGANIHRPDGNQLTPIYQTAGADCVEITKLLVENGANILYKDPNGKVPLHYAAELGAVKVAKFLIEAGTPVDTRNIQSWTPLMYASAFDEGPVVQLLINKGADVNAKANGNYTPLYYAAISGNLEAAKMLLNAGANPNVVDQDGNTPLTAAEKASRGEKVSIYDQIMRTEEVKEKCKKIAELIRSQM